MDELVWFIIENFWYLMLIFVFLVSKKYYECGIFIVLAKIGFPIWSWQFVVFSILYIWYETFFEPKTFWKRFYERKYKRKVEEYESRFSDYVKKVSEKKEGI